MYFPLFAVSGHSQNVIRKIGLLKDILLSVQQRERMGSNVERLSPCGLAEAGDRWPGDRPRSSWSVASELSRDIHPSGLAVLFGPKGKS